MSEEKELLSCGFRNAEEISSGAYAIVYRVVDNKNVSKAVKYLLDDCIDSVIEFDIMGKFRHPNLMFLEDIISPDECEISTMGIVLPLGVASMIEAVKLVDYSLENKIKNLHEIADALSFMHRNNALHLDIKLGNIILFGNVNNFTAKLSDFGLSAYLLGKSTFPSNRERVTITYKPPELIHDLINKKEISVYAKHTDIWSLGLCFYQILLGINTFPYYPNNPTPENIMKYYNKFFRNDKDKRRLLHDSFVTVLPRDIVSECINLVSSMLEYNPASRYTIDEVLDGPSSEEGPRFRERRSSLLPTKDRDQLQAVGTSPSEKGPSLHSRRLSPLFANYLPLQGSILQPDTDVILPSNMKSIIDKFTSTMINKTKNYQIWIYFHVIDIVYRCANLFQEIVVSKHNEILFSIIGIVMGVHKADTPGNDEINIGGISCSLQLKIITLLKSIVIREFIFEKCNNVTELTYCFEYIVKKPEKYFTTNLDEFLDRVRGIEQESDKEDKFNITIENFFES